MPTSRSPLIATLSFEPRSSNHLDLHVKFKSGDIVDLPNIREDTIKDACRKAGKYLDEFASKVDDARRVEALPDQLVDAFNNLLHRGCDLGLELTNGDTEKFRTLRLAFKRSWPEWSRPSREVIPKVQLVGPDEAVAFPLELVPMFDTMEIPSLENAWVRAKVASRFLGFTAVICRVAPDTNRCSDVLHNDPALPVQFVRRVDPQKRGPWWWRWWSWRRCQVTGFKQEAEFLASLRSRKLVLLDGPWPTAEVPADKIVDRLVDALYNAQGFHPGSVIGDIELAHIACHCDTDKSDDDDYELGLSTEKGKPRSVKLHQIRAGYVQRSESAQEPSRRAPVILNACGTSTVDPLSGLSFQSHFLQNRHRAFLGTQAAINNADAANYAELLYRFLLGGYTLGEAVVLARRQLLADTGSPLGILYVQYGNDQFTVEQSHPDELPIAHPDELPIGG